MYRTPLLRKLHRLAQQAGRPAAERPPAGDPAGVSRRTLVKASAAALSAIGLTSAGMAPAKPALAEAAPQIVVVGAGLAGLTAAYQLAKAGYHATVYEAADRVGGRCYSDRSTFGGQVSEHGGELIDSGHDAILGLIEEFGLSTTNLVAAEPDGTEPFYYFDGLPWSYAEAQKQLVPVAAQAARDAEAADFPTTYYSSTRRGRELDAMSIDDWIAAYVPGGTASKVGRLLAVAYAIEFGAETSRQSALNLIYLFGYQEDGADIALFGPSDETFHVEGGNDLIVSRLATELAGQITTGTALRALRRTSDSRWAVTVGSSGGTGTSRTIVADRVVLALPFTLLREVDLVGAGFPARKLEAINTLGMGTNSKLHLQFSDRIWSDLGSTGEVFADLGFQNTWEVTRGQAGQAGVLVNYTGGTIGASFGTLSAPEYARQFLRQAEPVLPGLTATWNGKVTLDYWTAYPWTRGSYAYYAPGQYTTITGVEQQEANGCHFAGEHTSLEFQGFMNGAVESGLRAAGEIIAALG
jgi:monoamine oxidase